MARRASAFASDLAELDNLQSLPLPSSTGPSEPPDAELPQSPESEPQMRSLDSDLERREEQLESERSVAAEPPSTAAVVKAGTRATQVRLPPPLAAWLGEEAHRTKKTLSTVVALAAREHRNALAVAREDPDGLDVARRVASGTVPVTLRLTGAQRQLLDDIADEHAATRSAVVVAALVAAVALSQRN